MEGNASKGQPKLPYVLVAVAVCLMACGSMGLNNAYGVFYTPMAEGLGVGRGSVTLHMSISSLGIGLFTPLVSWSLAHGHRMRNIMLVGMALMLASGVTIAFAPTPEIMNAAGVVRGIGYAAASMLVITLYIGNWFERGRGTLTGLALSGSGIGSAIASPIMTSCIESLGYRNAYLGFVAFTLLTIAPVALLCPLTPQEVGLEPYGASEGTGEQRQEANPGLGLKLKLLTPTFFALATFVVCICMVTTLSGHMSSLAQDYGYSAQVGALLLSACMVGNVASKFALGAIADRLGVFAAIVCSMVTTTCGLALVLLNLGGQTALLASGFLYGTCFSVGSLGASLLTRHLYGDALYADAYSVVSVFSSVSSALGVTLAGFAYDLSGSYATTIIAGLALMATAAACLAYLRQRVNARPWERMRARGQAE